jgi:hypothetical protein
MIKPFDAGEPCRTGPNTQDAMRPRAHQHLVVCASPESRQALRPQTGHVGRRSGDAGGAAPIWRATSRTNSPHHRARSTGVVGATTIVVRAPIPIDAHHFAVRSPSPRLAFGFHQHNSLATRQRFCAVRQRLNIGRRHQCRGAERYDTKSKPSKVQHDSLL